MAHSLIQRLESVRNCRSSGLPGLVTSCGRSPKATSTTCSTTFGLASMWNRKSWKVSRLRCQRYGFEYTETMCSFCVSVMSMQLRTLRSHLTINHFRTRVIALDPSPRRIGSDYIPPPRLRRKPDREPLIVARLQRSARVTQRPVHRLQIEDAFSR